MYILSVVIKIPLYQFFAYKSAVDIKPGCLVVVNFANREVMGLVWGHYHNKLDFKLKKITKLVDDKPVLNEETIKLINFCAEYYIQPIGEILFSALPKKLLAITNPKPTIKNKFISNDYTKSTIKLNDEQHSAVNHIAAKLDNYRSFLLYGITGSGKTEVYLQIVKKVINNNQQVLILVPEIGLTPQMIKRFTTRLKARVRVFHSELNATQKVDNYLSAKYHESDIILGTRSAVWLQFKNLGLIVVDEEHDSSFKQAAMPRYNAKNLAIMRAKINNIPIILGSATPSTDMLKSVLDKKTDYLTLTKRASGLLPQVKIINTKKTTGLLSAELIDNMHNELQQNKQVMLFINRRGYAPMYACTNCGHKAMCTDCDKALIYHLASHTLKCHLCFKSYYPYELCVKCNSPMIFLGYGTQRIEENLITEFKNVDTIRIDRDSTTKKTAFNKKIQRINSGEKCIIIGTQMLAKGHDFKNVSLVGVLDVDYALLSTNFRSTEELMQLLIQVAGRSGRFGSSKAQVLIQTNYPAHNIFSYVKNHNYALFSKDLLVQRAKSGMPPFSHHAVIVAKDSNEKRTKNYLIAIKSLIDKLNTFNILVSPVLASATHKKSKLYYYEINLYAKKYNNIHSIVNSILKHKLQQPSSVKIYAWVDPL